jgi:hypothetical protein
MKAVNGDEEEISQGNTSKPKTLHGAWGTDKKGTHKWHSAP